MYVLYRAIHAAISLYALLVIVWCLLSFVPSGGGFLSDLRRAIGMFVDPYLVLFRRLIPPVGAIDFSPAVAIVVLSVVDRLLMAILL